MDKAKLLQELETELELEPRSLDGTEKLEDIGWDSISLISYITTLDSEFGIVLQPDKVTACATVQELIDLVLAAQGGLTAAAR
jgi:acyl carrier protein